MTDTAENDAPANRDVLSVERVWVAYCSRCANEGLSYADTPSDARAELFARGWTREYPRTYCPLCNGETRVTPPGKTGGA